MAKRIEHGKFYNSLTGQYETYAIETNNHNGQTGDENLIHRHAYNKGKNDILFTSMIENKKIICKSGNIVELHHAYYTITTSDGEPATIEWRFGDAKKGR